MKKICFWLIAITGCSAIGRANGIQKERFPDGTPIPAWFSDTAKVNPEAQGSLFVITDFGVGTDSTMVQTAALQKVIDKAGAQGGGVIVIPKGTFLSGALFLNLKQSYTLWRGQS